MRSQQDLSEDLSSHLLPSPSSQLRHRTTLTLQPSRGKTNFFLLPQHRKRCTESTKFGRLAVISCFKERDLLQRRWEFRTLGLAVEDTSRPGVPIRDTREPAALVEPGLRSWAAAAGARSARGPRGSQRREHQPPSRRPHFRLTASPEDDPLTLGTGT